MQLLFFLFACFKPATALSNTGNVGLVRTFTCRTTSTERLITLKHINFQQQPSLTKAWSRWAGYADEAAVQQQSGGNSM